MTLEELSEKRLQIATLVLPVVIAESLRISPRQSFYDFDFFAQLSLKQANALLKAHYETELGEVTDRLKV
jgi:hypothetical protein